MARWYSSPPRIGADKPQRRPGTEAANPAQLNCHYAPSSLPGSPKVRRDPSGTRCK